MNTCDPDSREAIGAFSALLHAHASLVRRVDEALAAADKVPLEMYDVLLELEDAPGRRLRIKELAQRSILSLSGVSRLVDRMVRRGLVDREVDPSDRRSTFVLITDAGLGAREDAWPILRTAIHLSFGSHLTPEEAEMLECYLGKFGPNRFSKPARA